MLLGTYWNAFWASHKKPTWSGKATIRASNKEPRLTMRGRRSQTNTPLPETAPETPSLPLSQRRSRADNPTNLDLAGSRVTDFLELRISSLYKYGLHWLEKRLGYGGDQFIIRGFSNGGWNFVMYHMAKSRNGRTLLGRQRWHSSKLQREGRNKRQHLCIVAFDIPPASFVTSDFQSTFFLWRWVIVPNPGRSFCTCTQ